MTLPKRSKLSVRPAVFFDRDGTINVDTGYTFRPDDLAFMPGAIAAVKRVNDSGRYAFLVWLAPIPILFVGFNGFVLFGVLRALVRRRKPVVA